MPNTDDEITAVENVKAENERLKSENTRLKAQLDRAQRQAKMGPRGQRAAELNASDAEPGAVEDAPTGERKQAVVKPGDTIARETAAPMPAGVTARAPTPSGSSGSGSSGR